MEVDRNKVSPMMRQYLELKDKYQSCLLFYRLGDFYEMFFDDAITASKALELTLTGRDCGLEERAPMCGVPFHAVDTYLKRLIELGYRVAVCEQITDPNDSSKILRRDVVRIVTPGTLIETSMLDDSRNNFISSIYYDSAERVCAVASADVSTGEAVVNIFDRNCDINAETINELSRINPAEVIFTDNFLELKNASYFLKERMRCPFVMRDSSYFELEEYGWIPCQILKVERIEHLGLDMECAAAKAVTGLFEYIYETQRSSVSRFAMLTVRGGDYYLRLDHNARRNLELTETLRNKEKKGSLLWVLDSAVTSMGRRLLRKWIELPLRSPAGIFERQDAVEIFMRKSVALYELRDELQKVYDLERLMTKVMYKTANPRDLKALSYTAMALPEIKRILQEHCEATLVKELYDDISTLDDIVSLVENAIIEEPPVSFKEGGVIKTGFNQELDSLRHIMNGGKEIISEIEQREREQTGIKTLKIGFNRVFGYYIEVTRSYYDLVPDRYIRKQTLANCERFITQELKDAENSILGAKDKALSLEEDIFIEVRDFPAAKLDTVQETAHALAQIDVLATFADVSIRNRYVCPDISIDGIIDIKGGRHPVVENMLVDEVFVPNDVYLDMGENRMSIITGPNMSGKSTYMRQTALIVLMAQMGCFVPADRAKISIVDKIFTRVGASDDLTSGQSTFMVEMSEVSDILKHATPYSLVILDEVGRGTSTFDGISIARAVAEYICCNKKLLGCKTLFATHYHELIGLEDELPGVKNYSIAVSKYGSGIRFLRKIVRGGVDDSYGIDVAKLAGLPAKVVERARELLSEMESKRNVSEVKAQKDIIDLPQLGFADDYNEMALGMIRSTNVSELTDEECRSLLMKLEELIKS